MAHAGLRLLLTPHSAVTILGLLGIYHSRSSPMELFRDLGDYPLEKVSADVATKNSLYTYDAAQIISGHTYAVLITRWDTK